MKSVPALWQAAARRAVLAFLRWAAREIDPLHPDVPHLVLRINQLEKPL